jgi:hypothetical protein
MTSIPSLPTEARRVLRSIPAIPSVVALLLTVLSSLAAAPAFAQAVLLPPVAYFPPAVDSVVSKVNGPILDVLDGALQIDVTNAKITSGDAPAASVLPVTAIVPGSRIVAQVTVPAAVPTAFPPRLIATSVVVFPASAGNLSGVVQGVNVAQGSFTLLDTTVMTDAGTTWSGVKGDGTPVKSLADLAAGMQANVAVTADPGGVTAKSVFAYSVPTSRIVEFRGRVDSESSTMWTIGGNAVQVNSDTKIVGNPQVGDEVEVLERVQILPPGMGAAMLPVAISITKVDVLPPPPPTPTTVSFDGVVDSMSSNATGTPEGHWVVSGRNVLVTGMTKVSPGITTGTSVHVTGFALPMAVAGPNTAPAVLATSITKN